MGTLIQDRRARRAQADAKTNAALEISALQPRLVAQAASDGWNKLKASVEGLFNEHNALSRATIKKQPTEEDFLIFRGAVTERVPGCWFLAPCPVELEIRFNQRHAGVSFCVLDRTRTTRLRFHISHTGSVELYDGPKTLNIDHAASLIVSSLLDIVDPIPR